MHRNALAPAGAVELTERQKAFQAKELRTIHPVVRVHPETGERGLFVNPKWTSHIVDISRRESRYLLALLNEQLSDPRFTVRFRWEPGSIAFWDNRTTAHLPPDDVPAGVRRVGERITLTGDVPIGPDGFRSTSVAGPGAFG
jgi:taurine dioxygenase